MGHSLKVGDVVQLKSGGPYMTVTSVGEQGSMVAAGTVFCTWFDTTGKQGNAQFKAEALDRSCD